MKAMLIIGLLFLSLNAQAEGEKCGGFCSGSSESCINGRCEADRDSQGKKIRPYGAKSCNTSADCETGYCTQGSFAGKYCTE